eukprot:1870914-Rhodomonas_salina.1
MRKRGCSTASGGFEAPRRVDAKKEINPACSAPEALLSGSWAQAAWPANRACSAAGSPGRKKLGEDVCRCQDAEPPLAH